MPPDRWSVVAVVLALGASLVLLVMPIYAHGTESAVTHADGAVTRTSASSPKTLWTGAGSGWVILAVPVIATAVPALLRRSTRVGLWRAIAAGVLLLILPIGYFTVGGFYPPSALAMSIAARRPA